jgi:hypothetical protein
MSTTAFALKDESAWCFAMLHLRNSSAEPEGAGPGSAAGVLAGLVVLVSQEALDAATVISSAAKGQRLCFFGGMRALADPRGTWLPRFGLQCNPAEADSHRAKGGGVSRGRNSAHATPPRSVPPSPAPPLLTGCQPSATSPLWLEATFDHFSRNARVLVVIEYLQLVAGLCRDQSRNVRGSCAWNRAHELTFA